VCFVSVCRVTLLQTRHFKHLQQCNEMPPLAFMTIPPVSHDRCRLTLMKRNHFDRQTNDSHMDAALRDSRLNVQGVDKSALLSLCHFPILKAQITPVPFPLPMSYFLDILPPVSSAYWYQQKKHLTGWLKPSFFVSISPSISKHYNLVAERTRWIFFFRMLSLLFSFLFFYNFVFLMTWTKLCIHPSDGTITSTALPSMSTSDNYMFPWEKKIAHQKPRLVNKHTLVSKLKSISGISRLI
jgi:hypothetical protein